MVTSISPNTFGVNVESPWPPPNTFPIIPLLTITSTLSDDTVVEAVSPFTVPKALPPYTLPFIIGVIDDELSPIVTFTPSLKNVP